MRGMTTLTLLPTPARHDALAETAITVAGGGELRRLRASRSEPGVWQAEVVAGDGRLVDVRLDPALGTAYARGRRAEDRRAA
jgi:hypothetical protein